MTAPAGAQPSLLGDAGQLPWTAPDRPGPAPSAPPTTPRPAGATAMAAAVAAQAAAPQQPALLRSLRRAAGADPLAPAAVEAYVDAVGQREVGRRLGALRRRTRPTPPWHVLHDVPLAHEADPTGRADHVLVGPGGVYAVTTLHLPGARVRAAGAAMLVDGRSEPHLPRALQRARELQRLLAEATGRDVRVRAVVVVLGTERLALPLRSADVVALRAPVLVRWLRRQPRVLDAAAAADLAEVVRHLGAGSGADGASDPQEGFALIHERVRAADRLRRAWFVTAAVAGSTGVTTLLAAVMP
ncbi:nuclease-related domain-containing protein [Quadrisphaera setariae]|uniref:NERD domain-containing protein n=1 Tax=Quadrisphaera setariae TaxID=2593304 RepID=A0A5C8ZCD5_9ACTN|nr:nuclease-related domain-containing protein [Quadrisphaera setariae]TXR55457.1 NERD domain-containing protein [Quadrisphaera setariae]